MIDDHILQDSDIPFAERINLREHALTWISRDVGGIRNFIFPKAVVDHLQLTHGQVESSLRKILDEFFIVSTPSGKDALNRALACEHTSHLRHCVIRLRRNELTHQDAVQYAIMLESLWDSINTEMPDAVWAQCSLHFDTALISLRIVHLLLYLRQEFPANLHGSAVRAAMFNKVYKSFFNIPAPTDDKHDKHSTHFKSLLAVWRSEFDLYAADNFEEKLLSLEYHHGTAKTADILDQFICQVQVDDGWMLRAYKLDADYSAGKLYRKSGRRRPTGTGTAILPAPRPLEDFDELEFDDKDDEGNDKDDSDADYDYKSAMANSVANSDEENGHPRSSRRSRVRASASRKSPRIARGIARARRSQLSSRPRRGGIRYIKEENGEDDGYVLPVLPSKRQTSHSKRKQNRTVTILKDVAGSSVPYDTEDDEINVGIVEDTRADVYEGTPNAVRRAMASDERAAVADKTQHKEGDLDALEVEPLVGTRRRRVRSGGRGKSGLPRRTGLRNARETVVDEEEGFFDDVTYNPDLPSSANIDLDEGDDGTIDDDTIGKEQVMLALEEPVADHQAEHEVGNL